jgi:hypothetical protein
MNSSLLNRLYCAAGVLSLILNRKRMPHGHHHKNKLKPISLCCAPFCSIAHFWRKKFCAPHESTPSSHEVCFFII